jgi:hypothetical protein
MVDEIGGLSDAIECAAEECELDDYDIKVLPAPKTLADLFAGHSDDEARTPIRPKVTIKSDSLLNLLPPSARRILSQQVQTLQLLESRPVILVSPYTITIR